MFYINSKCIHTLIFDATAGGDHEGSLIFLKFDLKNKKNVISMVVHCKKNDYENRFKVLSLHQNLSEQMKGKVV